MLRDFVRPCRWGHPINYSHSLYACQDAGGNVLYVGQSQDVYRRIRQHRSKSWWPSVVQVEVVECCCKDQAGPAELRAIRAIRPPNNVSGRFSALRGWDTRRAHSP